MTFKPGQSGNPNGRPKGSLGKERGLTPLLLQQMETIPDGEKRGRTWRELLVLAWLTGAMKNPFLLSMLLERVEGKVPQGLTGEDGGPIQIKAIISVVSDQAKAMLADVLNGKGTETNGKN